MLAAKHHAHQKRKADDSAYINHLIEVLDLLVSVAKVTDADELCAAILHDSIEDTEIAEDEIAQLNDNVLYLVQQLTDDKTQALEQRRAHTLQKLKHASNAVRRIKLADITSNAAAIPPDWSQQRVDDYFMWLDDVAALCRSSSDQLFNKYQSTRIEFAEDELARLLKEVQIQADRYFGSREKALRWLEIPSLALGNQTPMSVCRDADGARLILDELNKLKHAFTA